MSAGEPILGSLYVYAPNAAAPIFFTIAYSISAIFHTWQAYRYKAFKLIGMYPLCAGLFAVAYALREYGAYHYLYDPANKTPLVMFIVSQISISICPPLLELANYHILGRLFYYVPHCSPLPADKVVAIFGGIMLIIEALNSVGASLVSNPSGKEATKELGSHLTVAVLGIQLVVILVFVGLAGVFHIRFARLRLEGSRVHTVMMTLYASMALIFVRCIYRLVERTGKTSKNLNNIEALRELTPVLRYEAYFYVFEASLMLVNSVLWNVWHPGRFLPRETHVYLAKDGTEVEGVRTVDERSALMKMGHVITFGLLFRNKKQTAEFQELREYSGADRPLVSSA